MEHDKWGNRVKLTFLHNMRSTNTCINKTGSKSISNLLLPVILFFTMLFTTHVQADVLIGAKIAKMMIDVPANKNPINIAVDIGYEFDSMIADLSLVGEINRTARSGKTNQSNELDFESDGVFILWKTTRSLFVTLRCGVVNNKIITGNTLHRSSGILLGASIGVVIGRTRLQIEYTSLAGDANFFGLGLEF